MRSTILARRPLTNRAQLAFRQDSTSDRMGNVGDGNFAAGLPLMKVNQRIRTVRHLLGVKEQINLNPMWQRGAVWGSEKQALLIDSILRQMDVPKLYLLECEAGAPFVYEAVDGQQRLRAIFAFHHGDFPLTASKPLLAIDGTDVNGRRFGQLPPTLQERFLNFELSVAEVEPTDYDDVRSLFLRLQMGVLLTPAELRNAMPGPLRHMVDLMAKTHDFFLDGRIPDKRYKRQDYLAHVFTLLANPGRTDLKAPDLLAAYENMTADTVEVVAPRVSDILDILAAVETLSPYRITQKWIFVDLAWLIAERLDKGDIVDAVRLATHYVPFERRRREHPRRPELLVTGTPSTDDEALYRYITSFAASGGDRPRLIARHNALDVLFRDLRSAS